MAKKNPLLPVHKCDICDFSTKNVYLYKRHKPRCRKDHGVKKSKGKPVSTGKAVADDVIIMATGSSDDPRETLDDGTSQNMESPPNDESAQHEILSPSEESPPNMADVHSEEFMPNSNPDDPITLKPAKAPTPFSRTYNCKICDFSSTKSRTFLFHLVEVHQSNCDIYACTICEYCSQFRNKMQRHMRIAHKATVAYPDILPEYEGGIKHRASPVKRRKLLSRNVSGKKLTVKFMKTGGASSKNTFRVSAQLPVPAAASLTSADQPLPPTPTAATTDHLSKIVDEITSEEGGIVYKCKECQFIADDRQKVAKHAVSWHVDTKSFLCSYCDYITFERNDFLAHRLTHRNEQQFRCNECTYSTDFRPNYERHLNNHRQSFPFKCSFCSYGCGSEAATRRHMVSNHDPVPPPPKKMKLPVPKSVKAGADINNTLEPNKEVDEVNDQTSMQTKPLNSDNKTQVKVSRKRLKASSVKQVSLPPPRHKLSVFEGALPTMVPMKSSVPIFNKSYEESLSRESSPGRKLPQNITKFVRKDNGKLECPACKLMYNRSSDLNRHMRRKHGCRLREYLEMYTDTPLSVLDSEMDDMDTSQASLDLSNTSMSDVNMSEDHIESADGVQFVNEDSFRDDDDGSPLDLSKSNEGESPDPTEDLACKYCKFVAKWPCDLQRHMTVHSLEKRYQCNFCSRKYKYTGDLNVHIRQDHKKQPGDLKVIKVTTVAKKKPSPAIFKCPGCTYTSCWKSEVDRHSRLHLGEKTFQCRHCDYQSFWRGDIRRHMYKRHPSVMTDGVVINDVIDIRKDIVSQVNTGDNSQGAIGDISNEKQMDIEYNSADGSSPSKNTSLRSTPDRITENSSESWSPVNRSADISGNESTTPRAQSHSPSPIQETASGTYKCQYCGFVASAPSKMSSHIATHTNLKRYKCSICGRRANWKWDIAKHIKKDHNNHEVQVVKLSKNEAEETIKEYMESNAVLRREHHLNITPEKDKSGPTVLKLIKCSACDFSGDNRMSVTRHIRSMHNGKEVNIVVIDKQQTPPQPQLTPQKTPQSSPNTSSQNTPPQLTPQKLYTASPVAPRPMSRLVDKSGLQDSARPFMCSECGKRGATKGDVKKHYHYVHSDKEIRIVYLGGGSQSMNASKEATNSTLDNAADMCTAKIASVEPVQMEPTALGKPMEVTDAIVIDDDDKPTVTVTNTKSVGYIRPFQCSVCSWRSNWRWALSKHIRDKHPGQNAEITILSENEARTTISGYIDKQVVDMNRSAIPANFKSPDATTKRSYVQRKTPFGSLKCSACAYRANQKIDVQRHIYRRHGAMRATVVAVENDSPENTIDSYMLSPEAVINELSPNFSLKPPEKKFIQNSLNLSQLPTDPLSGEASKWPEKKMWKCSMCSYTKGDKLDVLNHIRKHNLKTYRCTACNFSSNFRSGVYRHIKSKHDGEMAFCRMSIKLIRNGAGIEEIERWPPQTPPAITHTGNLTPLTIPIIPKKDRILEQNPGPSVLYYCKVCNFKSRHRSCVSRHILGKHKSKEYIELIVKRVVGSSSFINTKAPEAIVYPKSAKHATHAARTANPSKPERVIKRNFICSVCPYRTYKSKMLEFHMTCHKPQPGVRQVKCKYCPYYVSGARLLVQHTHLHTQGTDVSAYPHTPIKKHISVARSPKNSNAPKKHKCEKCPYASNSKNDFIYHKQFHRPKPTADFRCEYCEYWVTHKRLIKQHMKVHEEAGQTGPGLVAPSPAKSDFSVMSSENAFVYDVVEMAALKQRIISSKITPSISQTPIVSPMKLASSCSIGNKRGFLRKDGTYRKIHKCPKCPYMNIRIRNMRLHELMHGKRSSTATLMKCLHCDYYVGSKGLLGHHMKVHQPDYGLEFTNASGEVETIHSEDLASEDSEMEQTITVEKKVDTLLEIARFKKYGCEKCPYASAKRVHFQRHMELHGSKQKCKCTFCDYSVPTQVLLDQHVKLHFEPNQNLLAAQSLLNLQHLPDMPADVALASMMINNDSKHPVSVTHDHVDLYENAPEDSEPKKIYRCDRCPYANIRRDHLLAHLRCHMVKNEHMCPYCDYSVGKIHVLVGHIKVHFNPLPELSEWLSDNGEMERVKESKDKDMKEAIEVVHLYQKDLKEVRQNGIEKRNGIGSKASKMSKNGDKEKSVDASCSVTNSVAEDGTNESEMETCENSKHLNSDKKNGHAKPENTDCKAKKGSVEILQNNVNKNAVEPQTDIDSKEADEAVLELTDKSITEGSEETVDAKTAGVVGGTKAEEVADGVTSRPCDPANFVTGGTDADRKLNTGEQTSDTAGYVCQYCDRDFAESDHLVRHEMQHLIGSKYEDFIQQLNEKVNSKPPSPKPSTETGVDKKDNKPEGKDVAASDEAGVLPVTIEAQGDGAGLTDSNETGQSPVTGEAGTQEDGDGLEAMETV